MGWTSPRTWLVGEIVTKAMLDEQIRDNMKALASGAHVYTSSGGSVANLTYTAIGFDLEISDTDNYHDPAAPTRLTAPFAGTYMVGAFVDFAANATGDRSARLRKNATTRIAEQIGKPRGSDSLAAVTLWGEINLAAGDYVEIEAWQSSGGSLGINTGTFFWIQFVRA